MDGFKLQQGFISSRPSAVNAIAQNLAEQIMRL